MDQEVPESNQTSMVSVPFFQILVRIAFLFVPVLANNEGGMKSSTGPVHQYMTPFSSSTERMCLRVVVSRYAVSVGM